MENVFDINLDEEIVITAVNVIDGVYSLSKVSETMTRLVSEKKISDEDGRELLVGVTATLVALVRMLPKRNQKKIFKDMEELLKIDLSGLT